MVMNEKKVVENISGWLTVYDDGSVDRTWTGPPEVMFMADPVPPSIDYVDGVAVRDMVIDSTSGLAVRAYLPAEKLNRDKRIPIIIHFHGGGFCISQPNWYYYYYYYLHL